MSGPIIILFKPQMGENIGSAARAMLNFGIKELRIVSPRDGWPNPKAENMAADAVEVVKNATTFDTLEDSIADINHLFAATARMRDMVKPVINSKNMGKEARRKKGKCAIMFGPENSGLSNEEVVMADSIVTIPVSPEYTSLNLAQSVAVLCYEWFSFENEVNPETTPLAKKKDIISFFNHLENELDKSMFFKVPEKKQTMWNNIRNTFHKAELTEKEVSSLRGVIKSLTRKS